MYKFKLKKVNKPKKGNLDKDVYWLCESLCLSSGRDIGFTAVKIINEVLKNLSNDKRISSEIIAKDLKVSQGLVNHHLRNLIDAGILIRDKNQIFVNGGTLKEAVSTIKREINYVIEDIEQIAEDIDAELGFNNR
jgi:predicted transcriptional regulator